MFSEDDVKEKVEELLKGKTEVEENYLDKFKEKFALLAMEYMEYARITTEKETGLVAEPTESNTPEYRDLMRIANLMATTLYRLETIDRLQI